MSGEYARDFDQWDASGNFTVAKADRCYPIFSRKFRQDKVASVKEGRIVGADIEMVEVIVAGDRTQTWYGKVTDEHRNRWPVLYQAWKKGEEPPVQGTPLEQWPLISTSFLHELKSLGVRTVEQMANLTDTQAQGFMSGMAWRAKALEFLNKDGTAAEKTIRDLQARLAELEGKQTSPAAASQGSVAEPIVGMSAADIAAMVAQAVAAAMASPKSVHATAKKPLSAKQSAHLAKLQASKAEKKAAKAMEV